MISENDKVRSLCIPVFKTKRSVSVNISVMILEDGAGWNAGDWFDAPSYIPCVLKCLFVRSTGEYFAHMEKSPLW